MKPDFTHGGNVFAVARSLGIPADDILDFSASINPLGMPPALREAVIGALDHAVHYPDDGAEELKQALAARAGVAPENVTVANGSTELIHLLPRVIGGKKALIVAPPFSEYARALERQGWERAYFHLEPQNGFALDPGALAARLDEGWDALFLCNPNNPAGSVLGRDGVRRVMELCRRNGTFLVLDEAFIDFCPDAASHDLLLREPGTVVLRSLTKFFAIPGLRFGYSLAQPDVSMRLAELRHPWSVNVLAQAAGMAALADTEFRRKSLVLVREEATFLAENLRALPGVRVFPPSANYLLVRLSGGMMASELRDALLLRRILIRDCANFEGLGPDFFRVAVRTRTENTALIEGLKELLGRRPACAGK